MFGMELASHREQILQQVNFSSTYISMPLALTVEENLWVVARLYGLTDIERRVDDIVKKLEKNHEMSEDDQKRHADDVQKATDGTIAEIDQLLAAKEKEILTV